MERSVRLYMKREDRQGGRAIIISKATVFLDEGLLGYNAV
jgi:hypothetical protein